ncbi:MAG TPA: prenyltransferase [Thermoanaerobaculia bacterium]|nr:prenyltransferase [Thermoanaerobaculia bacterium]
MRAVPTQSSSLFVPAGRGEHSLARGLWRLADPKIGLASLVPFCAGVALAWRSAEHFEPLLAVMAFAAIFLVEVGKNAVNDFYDFRSGADTAVRPDERSPFSGGKRVLVDGLLTENDLVWIACLSFCGATMLGWTVAVRTSLWLLLLGAAAALISILYAMPPVQLSYRGLGELAVFLVYGPGIVLGATMLAGGTVSAEIVAAATTLGFLIANVLLANEIPDERADALAGKNTLVVRMGRRRATTFIGLVFCCAFVIPLALAAAGEAMWMTGALAGVPFAAFAFWSLVRKTSGPPVVAQTAVLVTYVVTGAGLVTGAVL